MVTTWVGAAAVAGLAGAPHCLGMCGALSCAAGGTVRHQVPYHVGRITTYAGLGAVSGALGQSLPGPSWLVTAVAAGLLVLFALSLAGWMPAPKPKLPGLSRLGARLAGASGIGSRLLFGLVNGLLPCGLVYAALALPVASADPGVGALCMVAFGLGTVPVLAAATWGLRSVLGRSLAARRVMAGLVLVTGLGTLAWREGWLAGTQAVPAAHEVEP